jgi:uncharacterized protein YbjQ (UPF0145 family)
VSFRRAPRAKDRYADHNANRFTPGLHRGPKETHVLLSTTSIIDGRRVLSYHGLVSGEAILGANVFRDLFAGIRDIVGGRSAAYEKELRRAKEIALQEMSEQAQAMGANAVIGVDLDYETVGHGGSMLMVSASGTAVTIQ